MSYDDPEAVRLPAGGREAESQDISLRGPWWEGESIRAGYPSAVDERTGSGGREETTGTGGNAAVTAQGAEGKERTGWQRGPGKTSGPRREEERRTKSS